MDLNDIRKIQERMARQRKQQEKATRSLEELVTEAQAIDQAKNKKKLTEEEKAKQELQAMLQYEALKPDEENKPRYATIVHDPNKEWDVKIGDKIEYFDPELSYELTGYRPITITEGLDFNPKDFTVAADNYRKNGRYTNLTPGTFKHKLYWDTEWDRCLHGLTIGKYRLTGENYFWLNYYRLQSSISQDQGEELRTEDFPGFINKQYEYFHYLELTRKLKKDGLAFKSRGVGASEIAASNCAHAYTFHKGSINIITAFIQDYVSKTLSKVWLQLNFLNTQTDGAFRHVRMKIDTDDHKRASKVDRDKNESGWMSEISGIVHDKPRKLRGDRVYSIFFEEAGSDPALETTYIQSEALVKVGGGKRVGSRYCFGTGGDAGPALEGLKKMFYNPEGYKILPYKNCYGKDKSVQYTGYFIPSYTMWFGDEEGNPGFDDRGVVFEDRAKKYFETEFAKCSDAHTLMITKAEFCFTPEDAFILEGSNRFDQELLVEQLQALTIHKTVEKPKPIKLHWGHLDDGTTDRNSKPEVEFTNSSNMQIVELPMKDPNGIPYNNLYVAGIDSIDSDKTTSTGQTDVSQFCMVVMRRQFGLNPPKVVAIYKERPNHIQIAFDNAIKLCQFYNCKALFEASRVSIKQHFERYHLLSYLMHRPHSTSNTTTRTNFKQYGCPATDNIIDHQLDLIEQYIVDYSDQIQFPDMIDELMRYSYENKRKFDIVAALGMVMLADEEMRGKIARPASGGGSSFHLGYVKNQYGQLELKAISKEETNYESNRKSQTTDIGSYRMHILSSVYQTP